MPLLIPDLPVFLRWRGEPWFGDPALDQLTEIADRLVLDSDEWGECDATMMQLPELFDRVAISDIAWAKVQPWREACAALWPDIAEADSLRVAGPRGETLLLWGWLRARLRRELRARTRARRRGRARGDRRRGCPCAARETHLVERPPLGPARDLRSRPDLRRGRDRARRRARLGDSERDRGDPGVEEVLREQSDERMLVGREAVRVRDEERHLSGRLGDGVGRRVAADERLGCGRVPRVDAEPDRALIR